MNETEAVTTATRLKNLCANGTMGYDLESGKSYAVRNSCGNARSPGHIFCRNCRVESGGLPRAATKP